MQRVLLPLLPPLQDALETVVYDDDETVVDVCARKIDIRRLPALVAAPPAVSAALAEPARDFVFIRVAAAHHRLTFS